MVKIIFLRHGYSQYNKTKQFSGHIDIPLEPEGYEQAADSSRFILKNYDVDAIYSSDLSRAVETARPIADALGLEIKKTPDLREINLGKWQNHFIDDVPKLFAKDYEEYCDGTGTGRATDGESYADVKVRALRVMNEISLLYDGKTVVAATHGGFLRAMLWALQDGNVLLKDVPIVPNASMTVVNFENGKGTVEVFGYNDYLTSKDKNTAAE
ncbi:MAG: histidine phosphatase family protein [Clostridia bacterium]|nr:histidine phosphatase family protein [Clostridia bacterium]